MALILSKANILTGNTIQAADVSQSIDAFTGLIAYDLTITGSLNATGSVITGSISNATSASLSTRAVNVTITNVGIDNGYTIPYLASTGSNSTGLYYAATGPTYNPVTEQLKATASYAGTASFAYTASYASSTSIPGTIVASGSSPITAAINFIAGATKTNASPTPTVTVNIAALGGKILGQTCFVTIGVTGSAAGDLVTVAGLAGPNLTFNSQNPNTDFYYHIIYT